MAYQNFDSPSPRQQIACQSFLPDTRQLATIYVIDTAPRSHPRRISRPRMPDTRRPTRRGRAPTTSSHPSTDHNDNR
ncbi:hypothetical protein LIA77_10204 [Sarocladium implicatum]|nr:hypothetical protein LIA77_10204 [Sarocladium implicatum]